MKLGELPSQVILFSEFLKAKLKASTTGKWLGKYLAMTAQSVAKIAEGCRPLIFSERTTGEGGIELPKKVRIKA